MEAKENRPDACTASGTAESIYKDYSTDAPDIQEEQGWLCLPEDCLDYQLYPNTSHIHPYMCG